MTKSLAKKRRCTRCRKYRTLSGFYVKQGGALTAECRTCLILRAAPKDDRARAKRARYGRAWRKKNAEHYREQRAAYREVNRAKIRQRHQEWHAMFPGRKILNAAKARAKKLGLPFRITLADIEPLPSVCPALGIPLRKGEHSNDPHAFSIDRIDNTKGYVKGNVAVVSRRANVLKRDATPNELRRLLRWLEARN